MKDQLGLVHIYCGDGKGKTTAAIGLAVRAAGCGKRVYLLQFLKNRQTGEYKSLQNLPNVKIKTMETEKFIFQMSTAEKDAVKRRQIFDFIKISKEMLNYDLLILDEIFGAIETETFSLNRLLDFLKTKPPALEVVLTGRNVPAALLPYADYISRMVCVRHPYMRGISARTGIEK